MEAPRLTQFMGYTALTSGLNEKPVWGHFMADYMDQCQERFEEWLEEYTERVRDDMRPMDPAPWICDRWRDQRFARSSHRTEDHSLFEPRQGYIQSKARYGYKDDA